MLKQSIRRARSINLCTEVTLPNWSLEQYFVLFIFYFTKPHNEHRRLRSRLTAPSIYALRPNRAIDSMHSKSFFIFARRFGLCERNEHVTQSPSVAKSAHAFRRSNLLVFLFSAPRTLASCPRLWMRHEWRLTKRAVRSLQIKIEAKLSNKPLHNAYSFRRPS